MSYDERLLHSARHPCQKCKKRGLGYAPHPHAFGSKDHGHALCRYCGARFKITPPQQPNGEAGT